MVGETSTPKARIASIARAFIALSSSVKPRDVSRPRNMFCATERCGASMISWWTSTTPRRSASTGPRRLISAPSSLSCPRLGAKWPDRIFIRVDLPAPFSPMIAWISPDAIARLMSERTSIGPKERDRPTASITGRGADGGSTSASPSGE